VSDALRVRLEHDSPRARYALDVLTNLLDSTWISAAPGDDPDLVYGPGEAIPAGPQSGWDEPDAHVTRSDGLPIVHRPGAVAARRSGTGKLGFDALYATYACLTAPWERVDPANEVGTPIAATGFLGRHDLLEVPLVHRYADEVGALVGRRRRPRRPVVVLTHDVDEHFRHLFAIREAVIRLGRDAAHLRPASVRRAAGLVRRVAEGRRPDPNDRWHEWAEIVRGLHGQATFFVASFNLFDRGAARYDVAYDARDERVVETFRDLAASGAEIGIHLSLGAHEGADRIRRERERLETAFGFPIRSARHHWWALGREPWRTLDAQSKAGFLVDCSFGFNDRPGFRRGIAVPFRSFDPVEEKTLGIASLPTLAMDRAIFDGARSYPEALAKLRSVYETVRNVGGALVLDWHAHVLNPVVFAGAGRGLIEFVNWALEDGAELQTPLGLSRDYDRSR
jgi:hypothetical protein